MGIMIIGLLAFQQKQRWVVIMAKLMNLVSSKDNQINPLIGAAGVSAANGGKLVSKEGQLYVNRILLMHAMGPNVCWGYWFSSRCWCTFIDFK